ncbi:metallophosphoesterase [Streptomyces beihaiensis]|uniref:Metallophosphoesterase n=1 Tax=Streptomyces beihaiensis TaxID=2984495 RepID=A0ABT3U3G7_9ACTN|nr:metallophosphoesterase [Streptomyces beihaiensis]MCX3063132.1 metallophosphoesterase [Streptomyces beihaiensis]
MVAVFVVLAVLAAVAAFHHYAWRRLVRDTTVGPGWPRRAGTAVFVAGPVLMVGALVAERAGAPFLLQRIVAWPGFLWMAFALYLLFALLVGEVVRPLLRRFFGPERLPLPEPVARTARREAGAGPVATTTTVLAPPSPGPTRRLVLARTVGAAATVAAAGVVAGGTYGVLRGPAVKRITVPLARLPRAAHGFRIAVVSDIHLGPVLGRGFAERVVDTINSTQPDLIAVVGDLVDGSVPDLAPAVAPLARLRSRHGTYFVTGNHEYYSGADPWVEHVREIGMHPLENARVEMGAFDLAGVNDISGKSYGEGPDYGKALGDRDRSRAAVLLAHQPVMIHEAVKHGVDLQLSGHTHGGQLWPGNFVAAAANPTVAGLDRYGDTQLYVSRGAGAWGPPVRVGAPSDITVVELASKRA